MTDNVICTQCGNWIPEGHECRDLEEAVVGDGVTTAGCKFDFQPVITDIVELMDVLGLVNE
jgi:hypothetical protein